MKRKLALLTGLFLLSLFAIGLHPTPVKADGIIIVDPPPQGPVRDLALTIKYHRVDVTIDNNVATTRIDQMFVNDNDFIAEGTYIFPVPEGAAISDFVMWVDGEPIRGEILEAEEARAIYEDYVRRIIDPALLEYVGRGAIKASIFPIQPGEERRIEIEYSEILSVDNGLVHYTYPLNTEKFSARPLEDVSVHVSVISNDPIGSIYSPSHRVATNRDGDFRFEAGYEDRDVTPDTDFELYYSLTNEAIGMSLLTFKESATREGFFLLLVSPSIEVDEDQVVAKDVILVLDTSGSMHGERLDQAKEAMAYILDNLNRRDHFNVVTFSTGTRVFDRDMLPISEADEAIDFVDDIDALGGTNISQGLEDAFALVDSQRPTTIILLSDGLATEGEIETEAILRDVEDVARPNVSLFAWGVGDDVDTILLDRLAQDNHGAAAYVREGERIDEEIAAFYNKISTPVLTDIKLDFSGDVIIEDFYPATLPDLFAGTQLTLVGRYRGDGPSRLTLTGNVNGERQTFEYDDLTFRSRAGGDDFIPRLWATRKIGHLLGEIRLHGEEPELVDAVVELSVRYGIITPYTSFLIDEDDILTAQGRDEVAQDFLRTEEEASGLFTGESAVDRADAEGDLAAAEAPAALPTMPAPGLGGGGDTGGGDGGEGTVAQSAVRLAGDKTFVLRDGVWIDTAFDPTLYEPVQVSFLSDEYFQLVQEAPELGDYFALGNEVTVVYGGQAIQVVDGPAAPVDVENLVEAIEQAETDPGSAAVGTPGEQPAVAGDGGAEPSGGKGALPGCLPGLIVPLAGVFGLSAGRKRRT